MKKQIRTLLILFFNVILSNTITLAGDQIVISADGTIQQTAPAPAPAPQKKPTKEASQNSKTKKNHKGPQKAKATLPASAVEPQTAQPAVRKTPDIILAPDIQGKTFRLHVKTKLSPAFAMIAAHDGLFLIMDKKYNIQLPDLTPNISFIKNINIIDNPTVLILRFITEPHINSSLESKDKNTYISFFYRDAASTFAQAPTPSLLSLEEKKWPNIIMKPFSPGGSGAFVTLDNNAYYVYMTTKPDGGYQHLYQTPYFKTALTQQGFAVHIFSNKTEFGPKDNQLHISHPVTAITLARPTTARHFQNIFDVHPKRDLAAERSELMNEKSKLPPPIFP